MKVLRICPSEMLPPKNERDKNIVYFVYDKMSLYLGKDTYSDPFCIVENMPDKPVTGMLYITYDGYLKSYIGDNIIDVGEIENISQLDYIKDAGNTYFMKAEYRYLDLQTRTIELPYQNGSFQLSVNLAKEIMINENTVIRYNPELKRFVIDGNLYSDEDSLVNIKDYTGKESNSANTVVDGNSILTSVKISKKPNNVLKVYGNGLYVNVSDRVSAKEFETLMMQYEQYKSILNDYIEQLEEAIDDAKTLVSETTVAGKISSALKEYEPTIIDMVDNYNELYDDLGKLKTDMLDLSRTKFDQVKGEITEYIENIVNAWGDFPEDGSENVYSPYTKTEEEIIRMIMEKIREKFIQMKEVEGSVIVPISMETTIDTGKGDYVYDLSQGIVIDTEGGTPDPIQYIFTIKEATTEELENNFTIFPKGVIIKNTTTGEIRIADGIHPYNGLIPANIQIESLNENTENSDDGQL